MAQKKILIVEDNNIEREVYQHQLEKSGYAVYVAENGPDAVEFTENEDFDLIILDVIIPGFDGFHVLEKVRANPKTKNIPIMVLTNLDEEKYVKRATKLGATEYLIKVTTTPAEAIGHIKSILGS